MSCLYYFKWSGKKRIFNVGCIVKWSGKIDKLTIWDVMS